MSVKRILYMLICTFCIAMCIGCGSSEKASPNNSGFHPAHKSDKADVPDDVQQVLDRGYIIVAVSKNIPQLSEFDKKTGKYYGSEIQLAYYIAAKLFNVSYNDAVAHDLVHFIDAPEKNRSSVLMRYEADYIIAQYTRTKEQEYFAEFSDCYYSDALSLMINKADSDKIHSSRDLDGISVGVLKGTDTKNDFLTYLLKYYPGVNPKVREYNSYSALSNALSDGKIDVFCAGNAVLDGYRDSSRFILADRFAPQQYRVAARVDCNGLTDAANQVISECEYQENDLFD